MALLVSAVAGIGFVKLAGAYPMAQPLPSITIKSDGTIDPSNVPISKTGNVYTLTGNITDYSLEIQCNNITVDGAGFMFQVSSSWWYPSEPSAINVSSSGVTIKNMNIYRNDISIHVTGSYNTIIQNNIVNVGSHFGEGVSSIRIDGKANNVLRNMLLNSYIELYGGSYNNIRGNVMNGGGIIILVSSFNTIVGNTIENCYDGHSGYPVELSNTGNSYFHLNNFINNTKGNIIPYFWQQTAHGWEGVYADNTVFDNGTVGNYWSDYNGTDANHDGIGDTPYIIGGNWQDRYPLMAPFDISNAPLELPWPTPLPSVLPSPSPSPSPEPQQSDRFRIVLDAVVFYGSIILIVTGLIIYFKKRKR